MQQVRDDFDRIALLTASEREAPETYAQYLLGRLPPGCRNVLDIGCGFGAFARAVAGRAERVTAMDLSPEMIEIARKRSGGFANIEFVLGDFLRFPLPENSYDCVVTLATLHHLPLGEALTRMKSLLRPGGTLLLHDLTGPSNFADRAFDLFRMPFSMAVRLWQSGRLIQRPEVRRAWREHGKHETYLTPRQLRAMRDEHLPGATIRRHLLWRYTVVWVKPEAARG